MFPNVFKSTVLKSTVLALTIGLTISPAIQASGSPSLVNWDQILSGDQEPMNYLQTFGDNPAITKETVGGDCLGVADPFLVRDGQTYHLFFEVLRPLSANGNNQDEIGHAYSTNFKDWTYTGTVFSRAEHGHRAAYPYVFKDQDQWYMIPDAPSDHIKLYRAKRFPDQWELVCKQLDHPDARFMDTNVFRYKGLLYLTTTNRRESMGMSLYVSQTGDLLNPKWQLHPESSKLEHVISDPNQKRGGGRPLVLSDRVIFPMQVSKGSNYGYRTDLIEFKNLTPKTVTVSDKGIWTIGQHNGLWNSLGMHHISYAPYQGNMVFVADGKDDTGEYRLGFYTLSDEVVQQPLS
ncbi:hypothetical protein AWM75_00755 [Aerococcus urinaehominis]|uniref:Glucosamine inositolphosphorylceramide transferase 1 N-terminal domain-containing protein n=1 Tax=Aerococcus urinaehominis TaxID=128944 RepID=A0A0X8FJR6_9LACT|nr:hypothetical protein [Aerococcus urinaehominis]AMB98611.1 hypothetical protein AWM75_00755 [Aerococcus urinaehominis]SDL95209.1 hypothetical protein SAMN04487985_1039 [Aerococcus urinaehominis]